MTTPATWQVFYPVPGNYTVRLIGIARRTGKLHLLSGRGRWCNVSARDAVRLADIGAMVRLIGGRR